MRFPTAERARWIVGFVLVLTAGTAVLPGCGLFDREPPAASSEPTAEAPSTSGGAAHTSDTVTPGRPFTEDDATRISTALSSDDPQEVAGVLLPEVGDAFLWSGGRALPAGATASVQTDGFVASEPTLATVPLVVTGDGAGTFTLLLAYENGRWLVFATEETP